MAKNDRVRGADIYHTVVSLLILLAGGGLLAIGIWLGVTGNDGPFNLDYTGKSSFNTTLRSYIICIIIGAILVAAGIAALIALSHKCVGRTFRVVYILMAIGILLALFGICAVSSFSVRAIESTEVRSFVTLAWVRTVLEDKDVICQVEDHFQCRGFDDGQCKACEPGQNEDCGLARAFCANCINAVVSRSRGCFEPIKRRIRALFLPMAIVSGILGVIVISDLVVVTCV